ncbi:MAG TPA: hypothetical protein DEG43_02280 [Acidimicrobiaceae bacterium]|nr:hypothetical protein [Acidimicrobiaceae bacterium]
MVVSMSGRRAKQKRRIEKISDSSIAGACLIERSADAVLAVGFDDLALKDRIPQFAIGLCRAAFTQSKAIVMLASGGQLAAAAPNRRLFFEAALRLHWLASLPKEERIQATDTILDKERRDTANTISYLRDLGHDVDFNLEEMEAVLLDAPKKGTLQEQARKLDAAVKAADNQAWSIYATWREESKFSHASGTLAGSYAPTLNQVTIGHGEPAPMDPELEAHQLTQHLIVAMTAQLLEDAGLGPDIAQRIPLAFYSV